jgi:uncharacterized membrane protein
MATEKTQLVLNAMRSHGAINEEKHHEEHANPTAAVVHDDEEEEPSHVHLEAIEDDSGAFVNERLTAYSDALFAIAMTIGVLSLKVEDEAAEEYSATEMLFKKAISVYFYYFSFEVLGAYWRSHNLFFATCEKVDGIVTIANSLMLFVFTFIPFSMSILALAAPLWSPLFFAILTTIIAFIFAFMSFYAQGNAKRLLHGGHKFDAESRLWAVVRLIGIVGIGWTCVAISLIPNYGWIFVWCYVPLFSLYFTVPISQYLVAKWKESKGIEISTIRKNFEHEGGGLERLCLLSDGVYTITATLIVLDIPIPEDRDHMVHEILMQWQSYIAYFVSFMVIGLQWSSHHFMFRYVKKSTEWIRILNNQTLFTVSLVPFGASYAIHYPSDILGITVFAFICFISGLQLWILWFSIVMFGKERVLREPATAGGSRAWIRWLIMGETSIIPIASFFLLIPLSYGFWKGLDEAQILPILVIFTVGVLVVYAGASTITFQLMPKRKQIAQTILRKKQHGWKDVSTALHATHHSHPLRHPEAKEEDEAHKEGHADTSTSHAHPLHASHLAHGTKYHSGSILSDKTFEP